MAQMTVTDLKVLEKWRTAKKMVIYYAGLGYKCCGDPLQVGDTIEDYFVTEEEDPTWGEEVYYDGHGNLSGDPARSFYVDGKVERIQALVKVEKSPEELLIDMPSTESPLPLDSEGKYSEWRLQVKGTGLSW